MMYEKLTKNEVKELTKYENELNEKAIRQYIFWKGFYDIEFFSDYFLTHWKFGEKGYIPSANFHKDIWQLLSNEPLININIIIARGHGKTTAILIYIIRRVLYFPGWYLVYLANENLGTKGIGKIRLELELNKKINLIFGNVSPKNSDDLKDKRLLRWKSQQLELLNGSYIETVSKGNPVRGGRPNEVIGDDVQENKDVENPDIVKKFNKWVFTSLYNVLLPTGRMVILGTIVGNLCLVKYLKEKKKWLTIEYEACDENFNNILWADMWSKQKLIERRDGKEFKNPLTGEIIKENGIGTAFFNQEFRNIPINKENTLIKEWWIRYYVPPLRFEYIILAIDPATKTKEKNDFTGITAIGIKENKKYVIYSKGVKLSPRDLEQFIISLNDRIKPNIIVKEENIEVKLADDLKAKGLPIVEVWNHKDKYTRLLEVAGMLEVGDVYFLENQTELIEQLVNFPEVAHDDVMDSFVIALKKSLERGKNNESSIFIIE